MSRRLPSQRNVHVRATILCLVFALAPTSTCVKLPRRARVLNAEVTAPQPTQGTTNAPAASRLININRATREELARLPGVGVGIAARIVEHRERYGAFRRAEHLLMVRGISGRRFEQLRAFITVE